MDESEERCLLEEYRANIDLWMHDDTLRQQRTGNFLTVNSILLVALSGLISIRPSLSSLSVSSLLLSIFGFSISFIWYSVMTRNSEYIRLRRFQLLSIESCFPPMTTFSNTYRALYRHQPVTFKCSDEVFNVANRAKRRSTATENLLPLLVGGFWGFIFTGAVIVLVASVFLNVEVLPNNPTPPAAG
jgi:hypothetical protein